MRHRIILCLLAFSASASAQTTEPRPLVTDRPDFTESAVTVAPRRWQLEAGYTFTRLGDARAHTLGEVLARIGFHERAEIRLGLNSYEIVEGGGQRDEGFQDLSLGVKLGLLPGAPRFEPLRPAVAVLLGGAFPTGGEEVGAGAGALDAKLALAWSLAPRLALGSNLNAGWIDLGDGSFAQFSGSLSLGASISDRVGAFLEGYGFASGDDDGENAAFVNGGLTLAVGGDSQLDARAGIGLDDPRPNYFAGLGVALRW